MTLGGWLMMTVTTCGICALLGWCIYRISTGPGTADRLHTPADTVPPDRDT